MKATENRELNPTKISIDSKIDLLDPTYVWCEGSINLIIEQLDKPTIYVVHYEGKSSSYDEVIAKESGRIAPHGTFTARDDIPFYARLTPHI